MMKQHCVKCIYDENIPGIQFDHTGKCNYCQQVEDLEIQYETGKEGGKKQLESIIKKLKKKGLKRKYDCIIGLSGGTDSSYLLIKAVEWGLRPLAVHYDNTWNSAIATENIRKVTTKLNIDLFTYVVDNKEADDIFRSFFLAGVPEFDASTDIAFVQVLRKTAAKYGVKYIFEGHSFKAEGLSPQGNNYFDGKYIKDIHGRFGRMKMKTFPNMTFFQFIKWSVFYRQQFIRPLWYIDYDKPAARELLQNTTGWEYYGGHHLENRSASFIHTIYNPQKFGIDNRNWSLSAEVRSGVIDRNKALKIYNEDILPNKELVEYAKKRMGFSDEEYEKVMNGTKHTYRDYKTYKKRFERLRPLFYVLAKFNCVPMSFYLKYCFPQKPVTK
jgi:N-acetyl sugar amidotransferase